MIRRLYNWVTSWAEHQAGVWALFFLAVAEASVFPIPPDVLLMALGFGKPRKAFWFAGVCLAGSLLGGLLGYGIGTFLWESTGVSDFFLSYIFSQEAFDRVGEWFREYDAWAVFLAAFTPIPYKVITISAGVFDLNLAVFLLASLLGRSARFFLVAAVIFWLGEPVRPFIEKNLNALTLMFAVLLMGGFVLIKYVM